MLSLQCVMLSVNTLTPVDWTSFLHTVAFKATPEKTDVQMGKNEQRMAIMEPVNIIPRPCW